MSKIYILIPLVLFLSITIASSQLNYDNPNLPKITSSTPQTTSSINNNTVNVNSSNCWQGDCIGFRNPFNQVLNTTSNVIFNQVNITGNIYTAGQYRADGSTYYFNAATGLLNTQTVYVNDLHSTDGKERLNFNNNQFNILNSNVSIGTTDTTQSKLEVVNPLGGIATPNYLQVTGSILNDANYPSIYLKGGSLATTYPSMSLLNGGYALRLASGNTATTPPMFLTLDAGAGQVNLGYNLTNMFTVTNGGNVGIGTITPSTKLDVQGGINVSGAVNTNALYIDGVIRVFDFNGYTAVIPKNNLFLMLNGAQYGTYNTGNNRSIFIYTTDGEAVITSPNVGAGFTPIKIVTNGTTQMTFSIDNKVGIGTEFPIKKLDVRGDMNVSGTILSGNITSPHQTYNYNGSVALNTQYNNTLDRPIIVSVTGVATVSLLNDIAYFTMKNGGSIPDEAQAYGCIKQITGSVGVSVYCQLTMTVPPGYVWTVNSTTGGSGTTTIEIAKVTVI